MIEPPKRGFKMDKILNSIKNTLSKWRSLAFSRMSNGVKRLALSRQNILILVITVGLLFRILPILGPVKKAEAELVGSEIKEIEERLVFVQENSLWANSNPANPEPQSVRKMMVVVTGYSSTIDQTDSDPFITAAGTWVRDGIVANNMLPFGVKVRIPELYGDKVFVVEDRMNWVKGNYHVDIWFASHSEALNFGAKITYIEVLGS